MLALNRKTDYALVALAGLTETGGQMSARDLGDRLRLPLPVLRNILKVLTQCGLLVSEQGSRGGYRLARAADEISVAEVIDAMEGAPRLARCCGEGDDGALESCDLIQECPIVEPIRTVHGLVTDLLQRLTLADLVANTIPAQTLVAVGNDERSHDE